MTRRFASPPRPGPSEAAPRPAPRAPAGQPLASDVIGFLGAEVEKLRGLMQAGVTAAGMTTDAAGGTSAASQTWLARIETLSGEAEETAEAKRIEAELASLVITDLRRAELGTRAAELEALAEARRAAGWQLDLLALREEAAQRAEAASRGVSEPGPGPASITVPLGALYAVPEPLDAAGLFDAVVADPAGAEVTDLAGIFIATRFLQGRLDWPATIELVEPADGSVWFQFSVAGEPLVVTRRLDLPLQALDAVFPESVEEVSRQATRLVEAASLDAAFDEVNRTLLASAADIRANAEDHPLQEVQALNRLAQGYLARLAALAEPLGPGEAWLRARLLGRRDAFAGAASAISDATRHAEAFHAENMPATYAGETYDRVVAESGDVVEEYGWRALRFLGNVVTLGGQSEGAENARAYRRGEISRSDYRKNWVLAIGRVGVRALTAALPVGRATGPAMRFLGFGGPGALAQTARMGAEFVGSNLVESLAVDAYSKAAAMLGGSAGVAAFQERQIGGLGGFVDSLGWGSGFRTAFGAGGRAWQGYRAAAARRGLPAPGATAPAAQVPEAAPDASAAGEIRGLKIRDEPNGDFAFFVEDSVSGKRLLVQGNRQTGQATVVDPASGEVIGSMQGGEIALHRGALPPGVPQATLNIGAMIDTEIAGLPPPGAQPLDFAAPGSGRPTVRDLRQVDLSDMPLDLEAQYVAAYPGYVRRALAQGQLPRLGNFRDYVRYRYGIESGQLVRGTAGPQAAAGGGGMDPAAVRGIEAGHAAEQMQGMIRATPKNTQSYRLRFRDPIRGTDVTVTVIPDFMPSARREAGGGFAVARSAEEAVVIADSKYVWDEAGRVALDDQIRGMLWLASSRNKPFVFLLPAGRDVSGGVRAFAGAIGAEMHVVTDSGGAVR